MTEVLYKAPELGHTMSQAELHEALLLAGLRVEPVTDEDTVRAAELIGESRRGPASDRGTLSLGDGLCLAAAERLRLPITGTDQVWETLDLSVRCIPLG